MNIVSIVLFIIGLLPIIHYAIAGYWGVPPIISCLIILAVLTYWNNLISKKIYEKKAESLRLEFNKKERDLKKKEEECKKIISLTHPFSESASMITDLTLSVFDDVVNHFTYKKNPANRSADIVKGLKKEYSEYISRYKEMLYKQEFLISLFPELEYYLSDEEALIHLPNYTNINKLQKEYDHAQDWLSQEEWKSLNEIDRNQRALDNWKKSTKSKWMVGMLYEMQISHILRNSGFEVIEFGIEQGLKDLGRDIIAQKNSTVYIIQCKNWSTQKEIHENVICQLFGTALEYEITHPSLFIEKVVPVIVTTTKLSKTANEFAKRLGVLVRTIDSNNDFPLIKCNINNGNKIYHLPFDQQYWTTKIDKEGEYYAKDVKSAVSRGFRRAYRWQG